MARDDALCGGVPGRGCGLSESICRGQEPIHVAAGGVADLRAGICDSHRARTLSVSEPGWQDRFSRRIICGVRGTWSRGRGERPRSQRRNRKPELARPGPRALAFDNGRTCIFSGFPGSCLARMAEKGHPPHRLAKSRAAHSNGWRSTEMN